ncbi:MAG: hypothetical protein ACOZBV_01045 [Pseudomonadota bacterium]
MQVSAELPLRANLSVLENIALVPQYRDNRPTRQAEQQAWQLLERLNRTACAGLRDPDLDSEQRFVAKLLRVVIGRPPIIVIERPGLLLPDSHYPSRLADCLAKLEDEINTLWIVDYRWNAPLYPPI